VDKKYWNEYYKSNYKPFKPSNFSTFVLENLPAGSSIIDIGCGNGRDSLYFANNEIYTTGVDQSTVIINNLKKYENKYLDFINLDLSELPNKHFENAYCRFLFHSINEDEENILIDWLKNYITQNIFIEARVDQDKHKYTDTNHYRRLMNEESFKAKTHESGFKILSYETSNTFSEYKNNYSVKDINFDPMLARIILQS